MSLTKEQEIINKFAANAHEEWRKGFDSVYAETGVPSKQRVKKNSDGTEGDINVPFEKLHADWQKENLAAGKAALDAFKKFPNDLDAAADIVHQEWMKRNPKAEWNAAQHVSYSDLPQAEKDKDKVQVVIINEIMVGTIANNIQKIRNDAIQNTVSSSVKPK
jgi:hypothetical protein